MTVIGSQTLGLFPEFIREGRAACYSVDVDPDLFFPLDEGQGRPMRARVDQARAICVPCPLRSRCLEWALDNLAPHGIWGALTPAERKRILKRRGITAPW